MAVEGRSERRQLKGQAMETKLACNKNITNRNS
jgi:hypothetical protein